MFEGRSRLNVIAGFVCALLGVLFYLTRTPFGCAQAPKRGIRIGGIFDLSSGPGAQWGITERNAFLLAIRNFRRHNPGLTVDFEVEDSAYSNQLSVSALQKLASLDGLKYIVGPTWEPFIAVAPVCESRRIICLAPSCNNQYFDRAELKYVFTLWFDEREYSGVHADFINRHGYKKIALVSGISPYYDALTDAFLRRVKVKPAYLQRVVSTE